MNSLQIKDERAQLKQKALGIIDTCKKEVRDLTDAETQELETIKEEIRKKDVELQELEQRLQNLKFEDEERSKEENNNNCNITKMNKKFSLVKAIRSIVNQQPLDDVTLAVIKAGQEEARKCGINVQGQIQLPTELEERAAITVQGEGDDVVATDLFDILTPLRANSVLAKAGARILTGLTGNVQYPIMSKGNCSWEGETAAANDGSPTFSHVTLSPKRITCYADLSRTLLAQDGIGIENAVRQELINCVRAKLEETILGSAAGTTTQPEGIFNAITPESVATFADICDLEADVEDANVMNECVYIMSNKAKSSMRSMIKGTNGTGMVFENGEVDGTKAFNTSNVADKKYIYGDFSNLAIGFWNSCDVIVDPYSLSTNNMVRIVLHLYCDSAILREDAFVTGDLGE